MKSIDKKLLSIAFTNKDLCARCGTCIGICPESALFMDNELYPTVDIKKCTECGLCEQTCPGGHVNFGELNKIVFGNSYDSTGFDGHVINTYVGYSKDQRLRSGGAGGGLVTSLMWDLMKNGEIDGCIVTRMDPKNPWIGKSFIARNFEDLLDSQGSRYMIIPVNSIFQELKSLSGHYAYAALPCQIHGFRLAAEKDPLLKKKIRIVIGLFCGGSLEPYIVNELLRTKGLSKSHIRDFQFRGGEWPGKMRAIKKNGKIVDLHQSNYKDGAYNYFVGLYMPIRCQTCIDGSSEFSDLSVSDAWTKDKEGSYIFKSHSRILVRTQRGLSIIKVAQRNGSSFIKNVTEDSNYRTHKIQTRRKGINAPLRVDRWRKKDILVPVYDREVSDPSRKELITEKVISSILFLGKYKIFRYPLLKFLTSKSATPLIRARQILKKRKYKKMR